MLLLPTDILQTAVGHIVVSSFLSSPSPPFSRERNSRAIFRSLHRSQDGERIDWVAVVPLGLGIPLASAVGIPLGVGS